MRASGHYLQTGTILPLNRWIKVRLVVYESGLVAWIVWFLESLGLDFFESIEDYMIDAVYEVEILLEGIGQGVKKIIQKTWEKITLKEGL